MQFIETQNGRLNFLQCLICSKLFHLTQSEQVFELDAGAFEVLVLGWLFLAVLGGDQMEQNLDYVGQPDREEGKEEPVILDCRRLEKFLLVLISKVEKLVKTKESSSTEVRPRITILEAKAPPKVMFNHSTPSPISLAQQLREPQHPSHDQTVRFSVLSSMSEFVRMLKKEQRLFCYPTAIDQGLTW